MRHVSTEDVSLAGQDSFLDIVANIVGILILLVIVVGVRSASAVQKEKLGEPAVAASSEIVPEEVLKTAYREVLDEKHKLEKLASKTLLIQQEARLRDDERLELNTFIVAAEAEIESRRNGLDAKEQRDFDLQRQISESQEKLAQLARKQVILMTHTPKAEVVEHFTTPLASVVDGPEVHLRLYAGNLAIVPFEELLDLAKFDAQNNEWRMQSQDQLIRTVGPIDGFRMTYERRKVALSDGNGKQLIGIATVRWELLPVSKKIGEPVDEAILPNSELMKHLLTHRPGHTTLTIWIYPNSIDAFQPLKRKLYELGYSTAIRPLPEGMNIGASPKGNKSVAQ